MGRRAKFERWDFSETDGKSERIEAFPGGVPKVVVALGDRFHPPVRPEQAAKSLALAEKLARHRDPKLTSNIDSLSKISTTERTAAINGISLEGEGILVNCFCNDIKT